MKKISKTIVGLILTIILVLQSNLAFAETKQSLTNEKEKNKQAINKFEEKKKEIAEEKDKVKLEIDTLTSQIVDFEDEISNLNDKIDGLNGKILDLNNNLEKREEEHVKSKELMEKRLVTIQESGDTTYLDVILSSNNLLDLISNYYLVSELAEYDAEMIQKIEKEEQEIKKSKEELVAKKKEIDTAKANKQSASMKLKVAKNEKNQKVANLSEEEKKMQARIEERIIANKDIDKRISQLPPPTPPKGHGNSGHGGNGGGISNPSKSGFIYPVPKGYSTITTGLYYSSGRYHGAVDFGCGGINGQPIYAVADGEVMISENLGNRSYGNYIIIAHYNGLYTLYAHGQNGSRRVSAGQKVKQGQQIMTVGTTGNSTGPHLHFEVRTSPGTYACRVDPRPYLP